MAKGQLRSNKEAKKPKKEKPKVLATAGMIESMVYQEELKKLDPSIEFFGQASPLLVPMLENDGREWMDPVIDHYIAPLKRQRIDSLILQRKKGFRVTADLEKSNVSIRHQ